MKKEDFYVYIVINKTSLEVLYVGKGKGNRSSKILSGMSNNFKANKACHLGETENYEVFHLFEGLEEKDAIDREKALIWSLQPVWNSAHINNQPDVDWVLLEGGLMLAAFIIRHSSSGFEGISDKMIPLFSILWLPDDQFLSLFNIPDIDSTTISWLQNIKKIREVLRQDVDYYLDNEEWSEVTL